MVRVMPKFLGSFHNQDGAVSKCGNLVSLKGYYAFGLQNGGECWSGPEAHMTYARLGTTDVCKDGRGGGFAHDVYFIGNYIISHFWIVKINSCTDKAGA